MGIFARPLGYLLNLIYQLVGDYGISLIILTVLVKCCLFPLYKSQIKSTAGMSDMAEKQKEIQEKYAGDRQKQNEAMQKLYEETGVNPMKGCLPMLIQFPIIMGLFALLRNPILYMPNMIIAAHESFLWIPDLAQPDPWILPLLAGVSTFFAFSMNNAMMGAAGGANMASMNMIMKYFFPLSILWLARSYPAGLAIYWAGGQILQIFFNWRINLMRQKMNEEKERKELIKRAEKELAKKKRARLAKVKGQQ